LGVPLGYDVVRFTAIVVRLLTAGLASWLVLRLGRSAVLAVVAFVAVNGFLVVVVYEPGHPQEIGNLLVVALPLVAGWSAGARPAPAAVLLGVVVAAASPANPEPP